MFSLDTVLLPRATYGVFKQLYFLYSLFFATNEVGAVRGGVRSVGGGLDQR